MKNGIEHDLGRTEDGGELLPWKTACLLDCADSRPSFTALGRFKGYEGLYSINRSRDSILVGSLLVATEDILNLLIAAGVLSKKQLMTTEELAELIRMKPQTIAKWRSAGITDPPPAIHLGRQVRYDTEEVMAWVHRNRL